MKGFMSLGSGLLCWIYAYFPPVPASSDFESYTTTGPLPAFLSLELYKEWFILLIPWKRNNYGGRLHLPRQYLPLFSLPKEINIIIKWQQCHHHHHHHYPRSHHNHYRHSWCGKCRQVYNHSIITAHYIAQTEWRKSSQVVATAWLCHTDKGVLSRTPNY